MREAMGKFIDTNGAQHPLFVAFYEHICRDRGTASDADFGTLGHMANTLREVACDDCFRVKGKKTAMRSFLGWAEAAKDLLKQWHTNMFILVYIGIENGHYTSTGEIPLPDGFGSLQDAPVAPQGAASSSPASADDLVAENLRLACSNSVHLAAEILSCPVRRRRVQITGACCEPLRVSHRAEDKCLKKAEDVRNYYVRCANGHECHVIERTLLCAQTRRS